MSLPRLACRLAAVALLSGCANAPAPIHSDTAPPPTSRTAQATAVPSPSHTPAPMPTRNPAAIAWVTADSSGAEAHNGKVTARARYTVQVGCRGEGIIEYTLSVEGDLTASGQTACGTDRIDSTLIGPGAVQISLTKVPDGSFTALAQVALER